VAGWTAIGTAAGSDRCCTRTRGSHLQLSIDFFEKRLELSFTKKLDFPKYKRRDKEDGKG
jgi:hypothetical protein